MLVTISVRSLLEGIKAVKPAVNPKSKLPVLSYVLLEEMQGSLRLSATNLETGIFVNCKTEHGSHVMPGAICPEHRTLEKLLEKFDKRDIVTISSDENARAMISVGKTEVYLPVLPKEEFPPEPVRLNIDAELVVGAEQLLQAMQYVHDAASKEEAKVTLMSVNLRHNKTQFFAEATNGFWLGEAQVDYIQAEPDVFNWIVPIAEAKVLMKLLKDEKGMLSLRYTKGTEYTSPQLDVRANEWRMIITLIDGVYPDFQRITPSNFPNALMLDRKSLMIAADVVKPEESVHKAVQFTVEGERMSLLGNSDGQESKTEISARWLRGKEHEKFSFSMNADYLIEILESLKGDEIELQFVNHKTAMRIVSAKDSTVKFLIVPLTF